ALFRITQVRNRYDLQPTFDHPIQPGQPGIERSMLDVSRHLLRPDQHALNFGIASRSKIRSRIRVDRQSRLRKKLQCRLLQTALWNSKLDFHHAISCESSIKSEGAPPNAVFVGWGLSIPQITFVTHDLVPSWQTTPAPSTSTYISRESRSQSVAAEITFSQ